MQHLKFPSQYLLSLITATAFSGGLLTSSSSLADEFANQYFSGQNPKLTTQERKALELAKQWQAHSAKGGIAPLKGQNGTVNFVYGVQQPSIVCAVLQVCDIALQAGEQVNSINVGDTARWIIEPALTGSGASAVQHMIIKPLDVGLETSLVVTTDRRAYHIRLRSHRTEYMPQVAFTYPEEALAKWDLIQKRETQERQENTLPKTGEYLGDLSFEYEIEGKAKFKPIRVYNDGVKTLIEMPREMNHSEAPSLMLLNRKGNFFRAEQTGLVNYRLQGNRYIVDSVFDKAILVSGVGKQQERVTITRKP